MASPFEGSIPAHIQRSLSSPDDRLSGVINLSKARRQSIHETRSVHTGQGEWGMLMPFAFSVPRSSCPVSPACPTCKTAAHGISSLDGTPHSAMLASRASMASSGRVKWTGTALQGFWGGPAPA